MSCCNARGCDRMFGKNFAKRSADRYRRRGLDATARRMVDFLRDRGIDDVTVLEIGGGVGEIEIELLKGGAARATNLELSPDYDAESRRLAVEAGVDERLERRLHDIAEQPDAVEEADVVVLHRVVCCYPDYERLLAAAAVKARRALVFSYPPRNKISRAFIRLQNLVFALLRREFRTFAHPPGAMLTVLGRHGLQRTYEHHGFVWQVAGLERPR